MPRRVILSTFLENHPQYSQSICILCAGAILVLDTGGGNTLNHSPTLHPSTTKALTSRLKIIGAGGMMEGKGRQKKSSNNRQNSKAMGF